MIARAHKRTYNKVHDKKHNKHEIVSGVLKVVGKHSMNIIGGKNLSTPNLVAQPGADAGFLSSRGTNHQIPKSIY